MKFADGREGVVDLAEIIGFSGVFESLKEEAYAKKVALNPELCTICWPNDADLCADVFDAKVTGHTIDQTADRTC